MHFVPTLDITGWAKTPEAVADRILQYYSKSNPLQSLIFDKRDVVSIQSAIFNSGGDMSRLIPEVNTGLGKVFSRYFPEGAEVTSEAVAIDTDGSTFDLRINVTVFHQGKKRDIAAILSNLSKTFVDDQEILLQYV